MGQYHTKKILFLDRDGVINKKPKEHEYVTRVQDLVFNEGIFPVCDLLKKRGYEFIIITNQRGVARGLLTEKTLLEINEKIKEEFKKYDLSILDIFYCPHDIGLCECRKPKDGMLVEVCAKYEVNLKESVLISDSLSDIEMGRKFGIGSTFFIPYDKPEILLNDPYFKKIKIAFIKYAGMISGGSEKLLQIIAANLPKDRFEVDFYYCDPSPYKGGIAPPIETDQKRIEFVTANDVRLIKFDVKFKDVTSPFHTWAETDFFKVFNEGAYDLVQTCRSGHKEFPFTKLRKIPIIDIIALSSGVDNQYNISRVLHICNWSAASWIKRGGDASRVRIVSLPIETTEDRGGDLRGELNLRGKFVFGMHQRASDDIFSPIPLLAYKAVENENTAFVILGGGQKYKEQSRLLGLKNIIFLPATGDSEKIFSFVRTLSVYAHGRKDGEVNSQAIAEGMYAGLPIVSHISHINNGHIECIGEAGVVTKDVDAYAAELLKLYSNKEYYAMRRENALKQFKKNYELRGQIQKYISIYEEAYKDPLPKPFHRFMTSIHYTQNFRIWVAWIYLKGKFYFKK